MRSIAPGYRLALGILGLALTADAAWANAGPAPVEAARVSLALDTLERWLATSPQGQGWNTFLRTADLRSALAADNPQRSDVEQILARYQSGKPGLDSRDFQKVRVALQQWVDRLPISREQLGALVKAAQDKFAASTPADEAQAKQELTQALAQFDSYLAAQGANGPRWGAFLKLDDLKAQLAAPQPDLNRLAEIERQFTSGHFGLQLASFQHAGRALSKYIRIARAAQNADGAKQYAADLERLSTLINEYAAQPTDALSAEMGAILGRLREAGQAPQVVQAVRGEFARPNLFVEVSEGFLARGFAERVDETEPVREMIEGTSIRGTAHTVGTVTLTLVPNAEQAVLQALFTGQTATKTTGVNGPARIYSSGSTQLTGRQVLYLDADGVHAYRAESNADTSIRTNGIGTTKGGIRGCIVERVASKRVAEAKPGAERTTSRKAETRLNDRLAQRVNKFMTEANHRYWTQIRQPLTAKKQFPEDFLIQTTSDEMLITGVAAGPSQLGASAAPPAVEGKPDLALRLHETAVNNFAQGVLAGETLHSDRVKEEMVELLGELPDRFEDEEGKAPWSITFADEKPVEVHFGDGDFVVTIRGKQYTADERTYRAMNVTAKYKIESRPNGLVAVRQGDLEIFPPGFVPGERRFSVPEQTLRSILERRFGKLFTPEIGGDVLQPSGRLKNLGELQMSNFATQAGWITVGWVPAAKPDTSVAKRP